MKRFGPLIKIAVGVGVGIVTMKANAKFGVVVDKDVLEAAIMAALAGANFRNKPARPSPQDPPESDR